MSSSFVCYREFGFWARDSFVEAFQLLLFEKIHFGDYQHIQWLNTYKRNLALQSLPLIFGGMSMCLDETLIDQDKTQRILQWIEEIKSKILSEPDYLTGQHLNSLRKSVREYLVSINEFAWDKSAIQKQVNDGQYGDELPVKKYALGFDLLRKLITGEIQYKANSPQVYWPD